MTKLFVSLPALGLGIVGLGLGGCATSGEGDVFGRTSCEKLQTQCQQNQSAADFFGGEVAKTNKKNAEECWARYKKQCSGETASDDGS